jgi:hypothetical protein
MSRTVLFIALVAACGGGDDMSTNPIPDACSGGSVTLDVTGPSSYVCEQSFRATYTVTNGSCQTVTVSKVAVSSVVDGSSGGNCTPSGTAMYDPVVTSIAPGKHAVVQDLTGNSFCCFDTACPATFTCDETFTYTAQTSAGLLTKSLPSTHIDLSGCGTICQ